MKTIQRIAVILALAVASTGAAFAQNWGDSQGNGFFRGNQLALPSPYSRPAIYFLGHAQRVLPPRYAFASPFEDAQLEYGPGVVLIEFGTNSDQVARHGGPAVWTHWQK